MRKLTVLSLSLLAMTGFSAHAAQPSSTMVVAPACLLKNVTSDYKTLSTANGLSLIEVDKAGIENLMNAKHHAKEVCGGFMDVTLAWNEFSTNKAYSESTAKTFLMSYAKPKKMVNKTKAIPYSIQHEVEVNQLLKLINPDNMWADLTTLSSAKDRYADSQSGVNAAKWLTDQVIAIADHTNRHDVSVSSIPTGKYSQPSVVIKIGDSNEPGIVIGAHMDTLSGTFSKKPGADDDGSGTVTVLEAARVLLNSGMQFKKPIYIMWYAAEEEGLVGSGYVVDHFKKNHIPVAAVLQMDMTGYAYKNESTIWLINDYVDKSLTSYVDTLIQTYVKKPVSYSSCGYACSDHASWTQIGVPSAFPFEAKFGNDNPDIHTSNDKMANLSLSHMTDYAKLTVAYAVELAEPQ